MQLWFEYIKALELGSLSCVIWIGSYITHESCKKESRGSELEKDLRMLFFWLWRWRKGGINQRMKATSRRWKREGNGTSPAFFGGSTTFPTPWFPHRESHFGLLTPRNVIHLCCLSHSVYNNFLLKQQGNNIYIYINMHTLDHFVYPIIALPAHFYFPVIPEIIPLTTMIAIICSHNLFCFLRKCLVSIFNFTSCTFLPFYSG